MVTLSLLNAILHVYNIVYSLHLNTRKKREIVHRCVLVTLWKLPHFFLDTEHYQPKENPVVDFVPKQNKKQL
jgi:hypothetical protein